MAKQNSVIIDPGHGGSDPGAVYGNRREKDDTLALAYDIGNALEQRGIRVEYTRIGDIYNSPYEKAEIGNRSAADLFLSIHRNAMPVPGTGSGTMSLIFGAETLCYRFARIDREKYGDISNVTDKGYYTNSYHVDVREKIDAFTKFKIESEFQNKSLGGAISYVEVPNLTNNVEAIEEVIRFIYDNIQYGEFNTKSDYCHVCGYDGEIMINDNMEWECPQCHNKDHAKMNVTRRTCGYLGENFWNAGKTKEIKARVLHL